MDGPAPRPFPQFFFARRVAAGFHTAVSPSQLYTGQEALQTRKYLQRQAE
jgi:hypothetical protein